MLFSPHGYPSLPLTTGSLGCYPMNEVTALPGTVYLSFLHIENRSNSQGPLGGDIPHSANPGRQAGSRSGRPGD